MSEAYLQVSTPWIQVIQDGETINTAELAQDYQLDKWQDITGNYPGVDPNEYLIEIWCDYQVAQDLQADTKYVIEPNSYRDLQNPGSEIVWPPVESFFQLYKSQKVGTGQWNQGQLIKAIGNHMNGRQWSEVHERLLAHLKGLTP